MQAPVHGRGYACVRAYVHPPTGDASTVANGVGGLSFQRHVSTLKTLLSRIYLLSLSSIYSLTTSHPVFFLSCLPTCR